jgi:large subunit ribosomal protein L21
VANEPIAVIETGGKQYIVSAKTVIDIEKLDGESKGTVSFDKVLLYSDGKDIKVGQPYLKDASVSATIMEQHKDKKKIVFKFKRKTGYKKKQGHRQQLTCIRVDKIKA